MNNMCVTHPPLEGKEDDKAKYAGRDVLHQFLTNGGYGATVQYYGTEDGILHLQPATKLDKCRHYDPRFAYVSVNNNNVDTFQRLGLKISLESLKKGARCI